MIDQGTSATGRERVQASGRIVVIDPSCASAHGHHLQSLKDILAATAPRQPTLYVNARLPRPAFSNQVESDVHRAFTQTVYDEPGLGPRPNGRLSRRLWKAKRAALAFENSARRLLVQVTAAARPSRMDSRLAAEDWEWALWRRKWPTLEELLEETVDGPVAHIVAPSADVELVCGLAEARRDIAALKGALVHARIITPVPALKRLSAPDSASSAYHDLHAARMQGVHLYVETPAMQRHLQEAFGLASDVYPYLIAPPDHVPITGMREAGPVQLGYFGGKRNEKGFKRLAPILALVAQWRRDDDPALHFFIHGSDASPQEGQAIRDILGPYMGTKLSVEVATGALSDLDYRARFGEMDAIMLPYTGTRYRLAGSGIVCEALAMGKAIVMSSGLSFAEIARPDTAIEADDDINFARAILAMARDIRRYRAAAAARAHSYAAEVAACPLLARLRG